MTTQSVGGLFDRVYPILGSNRFADHEVMIVGLGSGGSKCAEHLAKSGLSRFIFVDPEILGVENVCRHACGLSAVGQPKVDAMRAFVLDRNPHAVVTTFQNRVDDSQRDWLLPLLRQGTAGRAVSLVVCGTDTQRSKQVINSLCVEAGVPAIFAGCFEKACGGEVIRYRPGEACFGCINSFLRREGLHDTLGKKSFNYSELEVDAIADERPEPGLGMDVEFIALIQAKMALLTMLGDDSSGLQDFRGNYVLFGNRPCEGLFTNHLQSFIYHVPPQDGCLVCRSDNVDQAAERARVILSAATTEVTT